VVLAGLIGVALAGTACADADPPTGLLVAASADLQDVLPLLARAFEVETGIAVQPQFGSSKSLATDVRSDEPFDLIISPDADLIAALAKDGHLADTGTVVADSRLAIAVHTTSPVATALTLASFTIALRAGRVRRIAIAHPDEDVFGQCALDVLQQMRLADFARPKFVYTKSVAEAAQMVSAGTVDTGIVPTSLLMAEAAKTGTRTLEINPSWHRPLSHRVALTPDADTGARQFLAYLQTPVARRTWRQFGYGVTGS
jgi:molybdate transport system substrate-binding protein